MAKVDLSLLYLDQTRQVEGASIWALGPSRHHYHQHYPSDLHPPAF